LRNSETISLSLKDFQFYILANLNFMSLISILCLLAIHLTPDNISQVVAEMTTEEKVLLLIGNNNQKSPAEGDVGYTLRGVPGAAGMTYAIPRLGIPAIILADGPAGLRINPTRKSDVNTYYCTGFPIGTMLSSTWNTETVQAVGAAMGNEVLEYGVDILLAPGANIHRNPLCGRNFEYYSEDPVLAGKTAAAFINGVQSQGVGTSLKHFALNNQEFNRLANNVIVSERAMREIYLKAFEIAVKESQPWTIMTAYNYINGVHAAENKLLITDILRGEWGFKGAVMTDWGGGYRSGAIIAAGNDMIQPGSQKHVDAVIKALDDNSLSAKELDECVTRVLELIVKTPTFRKYAFSSKPDLEAHAKVSCRAAEEGMILLKKSALPYSPGTTVALFGVGSYSFIAGGTGSGDVHKPYVLNLDEGLTRAGLKLDEATAGFYENYMVEERQRCSTIDGKNKKWYLDAERPIEVVPDKLISDAARTAESAIITITRIAGEGKDRSLEYHYNLSQAEHRLIDKVSEAFHGQKKKVTLILNVCGVVDVASWRNKVDDILICWLPGQDGAVAVGRTICGAVNPSGRLPMTLPISYWDVPSAETFPLVYADKPVNYSFYRSFRDGIIRHDIPNIDYTEYSEDVFVGYRYFATNKVKVAYPFGYGLSYTSFKWSKTTVEKAGDGYDVSVCVTNTGKCAGKDVVEVYAKGNRPDSPCLELKGFCKTKQLSSGETQQVTVHIPASALPAGYRLVALKNAGYN